MALVPLLGSPSRSVDALLVHQSGLLDGLIALFDEVWRKATPLVLDRGSTISSQAEGLTELDTRIFALLLAGLTDRAIAHQLGVSLRTVQRRVKFLKDAVGAETRLQLGFHAARNGWDAPRPQPSPGTTRP
ncbi:helix-turn-helix domain-containing protein [Kribbella sp. NPDC048915]|uniref:winged helix-turn-helix transcriptional regulator n=1 Tax=Kribbella sp. NPDC048915 TaxID=3155148 RepID=UPI0033F2FA9B